MRVGRAGHLDPQARSQTIGRFVEPGREDLEEHAQRVRYVLYEQREEGRLAVSAASGWGALRGTENGPLGMQA